MGDQWRLPYLLESNDKNATTMTTTMTMSNYGNSYKEEDDCSSVIVVVSNNNILQLVWDRITITSNDNDNDNDNDTSYYNTSFFNPLQQCVLLCSCVSLFTFLISTITKNYSQVDKLWSMLPWMYTWILSIASFDTTFRLSRTFIMSCVATIWGVRLTYNFNRRGGYNWPKLWTGEEDYRWKIIQQGELLPILSNKVVWNIFNLTFISLYQNILLLWIVTPSMIAYVVEENTTTSTSTCPNSTTTATSLNVFDYAATILCLTCIVIETIADNQQYHFQTTKYKLLPKDKKEDLTGDYKDGFNTSGLFSICRKPNYAAEQLLWMSYYLYSVAALHDGNIKEQERDGSSSSFFSTFSFLFNWSISGCIMLCLLFQGSGWFTEKITLSKYPNYKEYMKRTPLYVPNLLEIYKILRTATSTITATSTNKNKKTKDE